MTNDLTKLQQEKELNIQDANTQKLLLSTVFKGLSLPSMLAAIAEANIRGFPIKKFLDGDVYAIPYGQGYSLVTSIDYARKIAMRSGVVGVSEPVFEDEKTKTGTKIISCTVVVKRKTDDYVGDFTAKVYFDEYTTGKNLWATKPRTMIGKVAQMHALRMAAPEELSKMYVGEEMEKEKPAVVNVEHYREKLQVAKTLAQMKSVWVDMPQEAKVELEELKNEIKTRYENTSV